MNEPKENHDLVQ